MNQDMRLHLLFSFLSFTPLLSCACPRAYLATFLPNADFCAGELESRGGFEEGKVAPGIRQVGGGGASGGRDARRGV